MSQKTFIGTFVSVVLAAILVNSSTFLVRGIDQVVLVRMGRIVRVINQETGLYLKWPLLDEVVRVDKRVMVLNSEGVQVPTSGSEFITVNTAALWRIADPSVFIQTARTEEAGAALLDQILTASVRSQAAELTVDKVVGGALVMCANDTTCESPGHTAGVEVAVRAKRYGIDLRDFRVLGVSQTASVHDRVESRMIAERLNAADQVYSEGEMTSARIAADAELQVQTIISRAQQDRDDILAKADQQILRSKTQAYRNNQEFYTFFRTLEAYGQSLNSNTTIMIPASSDFFRFLQSTR